MPEKLSMRTKKYVSGHGKHWSHLVPYFFKYAPRCSLNFCSVSQISVVFFLRSQVTKKEQLLEKKNFSYLELDVEEFSIQTFLFFLCVRLSLEGGVN